MKFREYRPNYFSGYDNKEIEVVSLKDIFEIEFVKNFSKDPNFHCYAVSYGSVYQNEKSPDHLMGLFKHDKDSGKCSEWWVIGYLIDFQEIDLPKYEELILERKN